MKRRQAYPNYDPDLKLSDDYKVVLFGPRVARYNMLCAAFTVEKITVVSHVTEDAFDTIALRSSHFPRARAEGILYRLTEDQFNDLDIDEGNGVYCDRKLTQFMLPYLDENGEFIRTLAHSYMASKDGWIHEIDLDRQNHRCGDFVLGSKFELADRVVDNNPILHNRFCVIPPYPSYQQIGEVSERMRIHCKKRNKQQLRKLAMRRMAERLRDFVSDE